MNDETSKRWRARNRTLTPGTIKFSIHANSEYPSMILQTVTGSARRGRVCRRDSTMRVIYTSTGCSVIVRSPLCYSSHFYRGSQLLLILWGRMSRYLGCVGDTWLMSSSHYSRSIQPPRLVSVLSPRHKTLSSSSLRFSSS